VVPALGWQAPFSVRTGSVKGTTLVLGRVFAGGVGGAEDVGVAAGACAALLVAGVGLWA